ncbi:hypothetical protein SARC_14452 [Sphaeroforma arctica JP610]|uniref:Transcription initiation factor IIE subunit beta n=1 Tax=Sphaeroforma arctica JP610 TaxID=667725 RepID=A0A0L0F8V7_9EUKA|nr:hypothetical protein SARC_14452 [Sphaeroforma arctica JP610]KNC72986.1 hypothetical protein SARC_14452 [Sphaeroforma arctica JP610]|eukprot:XP_014146888.1 hypothetical protein SARC_14452 [Sphaeroforma arctica JP610]
MDFRNKMLAAQDMKGKIERDRERKKQLKDGVTAPNRPFGNKKVNTSKTNNFKEKQIGQRLRSVVDYLRQHQGEKVPLDVLEREVLGHTFDDDTELTDNLLNNERTIWKDGAFAFNPKFNCGTAEQLQDLLTERHREGSGGITLNDLLDSNPEVQKHVDRLQKEGKILVIKNNYTKNFVLFHREHSEEITIDEKFVLLWQEISVADSVAVDQSLKDAGMSSSQQRVRGKSNRPGSSKRQKKETKIRNFKNEHMLGLGIFDDAVDRNDKNKKR